MENKFNIDSSEIKRILLLHENATKKQYLNVLNEAETTTYTLKADVTLTNTKTTEKNLYMYKGTQFYKSPTKPGVLQTSQVSLARPELMTGQKLPYNNVKANVYYSCSKGKFWIDGTTSFYNQAFQKNLGPLCQNKSQNNTAITSKAVGAKLLKNNVVANDTYELKNENPSGKNASVVKGVQFYQTDKPNILKTSLVNAGSIGAKEIGYDCVTGKFIIGNSLYNNEKLENAQLKPFCKTLKTPSQDKNKLNPQGYIQPKGSTPIVIPTDIDLSQITKDLPPELQTVLTPPTVDGQPNTSNTPDFNQLLTQLQGLQ